MAKETKVAKLTTRDLFNAIVSYGTDEPVEITEEMVAKAQECIASMDKANEKSRVTAAKKRAEAGPSNVAEVEAKIMADIKTVLTSEPQTREQVFEALGGSKYTYEKADKSVAPITLNKISTVAAKAVAAGMFKTAPIMGSTKKAYVL